MKKNRNGFTLIELILYIALVAIFVSGAILFAWDIIYGRVKSTVHQEVNQNLRIASKRIAFEIRNASAINSVTPTSISLASTDASRNPTVIDLSSDRVRIGYGGAGNCPTSAPCFLTSNQVSITNLLFTDMSAASSNNIRFSITAESIGQRQEWDVLQTITTSSELRTN